MKVGMPRINQRIATSLEKFSKNGGEKVSNYVNAAGKAIIAPLIILNNPFTKEDKENKQWAAIKQPIEAVLTIGMQLASLAVLYKGIDKLINKGKLNFKFIEDAKKDISKIPKKIMDACGGDKEKAIAMYSDKYNEVFKDRVGAVVSAVAYIPVLAISNKIYPKIAQKLVRKNDENKSVK